MGSSLRHLAWAARWDVKWLVRRIARSWRDCVVNLRARYWSPSHHVLSWRSFRGGWLPAKNTVFRPVFEATLSERQIFASGLRGPI
jgi:hypothetical protein